MQLRQDELTVHVLLDQRISWSDKHSVTALMTKGMQFQTLVSKNSKSRYTVARKYTSSNIFYIVPFLQLTITSYQSKTCKHKLKHFTIL